MRAYSCADSSAGEGSALRCRRSEVRIPGWAGYGSVNSPSLLVRLLVRSACVAGYNRQPRTHAPALLNYLITSQQLAVRRTRKPQNKRTTTRQSIPPQQNNNIKHMISFSKLCVYIYIYICLSKL